MTNQNRLAALVSFLALPLASVEGAEDVVITELMASNGVTLLDEDGDTPDWVELFNPGAAPVNLAGWSLTDDLGRLGKWVFPAVTIPPDRFLIVFASGKDRRRAGSPLHTSFELSSLGGDLALVRPDGSISWSYAGYPELARDYSYGLAQDARSERLVDSGAPALGLVPSNGSLGLAWTGPDFDDGAWTEGTSGIGYDRNPDYLPLIGIDVRTAMDGLRTSAYLRIHFPVADPSAFTSLALRMKYDDGFIAYLNGSFLGSRNAPDPPAWDSRATALNDDARALVFEDIPLGSTAGLLRAGDNVLAIHGLNDNSGSSDFLALPELEGLDSGTLDRDRRLVFHRPSPGAGNLPGFPGAAGRVVFSRPGGVFTGTLAVSLSSDPAGGSIRYTLNGTEPGETSTLYTGPISLTAGAWVRARVFAAGLAPGPISSESFIALASDVRTFSSDIPVMLLETFNGGAIPATGFDAAHWVVFEPGAGRTSLTAAPTLETRAGIRVRGSSTAGQPKPNLAMEAWDEHGSDRDVSPLGLPAEADWILHAPYGFDRALIRNPLMYELSNRVGRYAVRCRFVELFINTGGGALSQADYFGVYVFMEKIERDDDRVDVERLDASMDSEPLITGGYMFKIDRLDPGDSGFSGAGQRLGWVYPKEEFVSPAQAAWLPAEMNAFAAALNGPSFADPATGYAAYIDPDSWIDHHLLNVLALNVDALRLSTYYHKRREGRIEAGPIWDFDRSLDSTDGRDDNAFAWKGTGDATDFFNYPWWARLFQDPEFYRRYQDRWHELRRGPFATGALHEVIDAMAGELSESQARNYQRWGSLGAGGYQGEIDHLKDWIADRAGWIDSQYRGPPVFSSAGGPIAPGFRLTITTAAGEIRYTTDGTDPRLRGGGISTRAALYSGPITLDANARVVARARISAADWSASNAATFVVETPRLVITEAMYHPADPPPGSFWDADDFEFLELWNAGSAPLALAGASVEGGIAFTFPPGEPPLEPGRFVLLLKNLEAFETRYATQDLRIAGEYTGNLGNDGDSLRVLGPLREPILDLAYSDQWHIATDGLGRSLVVLDPSGPLASWALPASWGPGTVDGGTPGEDEEGSIDLGGRQLPGDGNGDGRLDLSDALSLLLRLYAGTPAPLPCQGAIDEGGNLAVLDLNGDAGVDASDAIHLLTHLFRNGPAPAAGDSCRRIEGCPHACALP